MVLNLTGLTDLSGLRKPLSLGIGGRLQMLSLANARWFEWFRHPMSTTD